MQRNSRTQCMADHTNVCGYLNNDMLRSDLCPAGGFLFFFHLEGYLQSLPYRPIGLAWLKVLINQRETHVAPFLESI